MEVLFLGDRHGNFTRDFGAVVELLFDGPLRSGSGVSVLFKMQNSKLKMNVLKYGWLVLLLSLPDGMSFMGCYK